MTKADILFCASYTIPATQKPVATSIEELPHRGWRSISLSYGWQAAEPSHPHNQEVDPIIFRQEPDRPFTDNTPTSTF